MFKNNIHEFLLNLGYETNNLPFQFVLEKHYRIPSIGKSRKNRSTDVILKSNGLYLIYDHSTGESYTFNPEWKQEQQSHDAEYLQKRQLEIEKQRKAEEKSKIIQFASKANEAKEIWNKAQHCEDHPYMAVAGIKPINARTMPVVKTSGGQTFHNPLIIPLFDVHSHELVNLQFITPEGEKRPLSGAQSQNFYFVIEGAEPTIFVEGYKDACNVHLATGRRAIACITADKIKEVYPILGKQQDAILSDNDNKAKINDDGSRKVLHNRKQIAAYGKGHKVATELGTRFYLAPELGSDAGSMTHDQINALLNDKATSELPIFDVWSQLKDQPCDIDAKLLLSALTDEKDAHQCAVLAYQYMIRNSVHVPYRKSLIELRNEIEPFCVGRVHPVTLDNIVLYVHKRIEFIKTQGLTAVTIQDYKNHNVIKLDSLDQFKPNYRGVYLIKAPTGSGKTQKVGRPFRDWCDSSGYSLLTIAHLRSLIREMASRLNTAHYDDEKKGIAEARKIGLDAALSHSIESLSVCLPSLANELFKPFIKSCKHVFIDEISQVIETFNSDKLFKKTDIELVYKLLKTVIKNAECVIVADANINQQTLDFIESCRLGEKLNIVEVDPKNENKTAHLYNSFAELQSFMLQRVMVENQNAWITCDSRRHVQALQAILNDLDVQNISIIGNENVKKETAEFLKNPETESLKYQVVISTSAIASGVSIEHDHFDFVAGFFTGSSVQPTDAYQMLGRVRQCKEFHLFADQNRRYVMDVLDALQGKQQASVLEGSKAKITEFSLFKTELEKIRETRRSNFANNLIWILESKKFTVKRVQQFDASSHAETFKYTKDKIKADHQDKIKAAYKIDAETAQRLQRKDFLSDPEAYALQAHEMRMKLGLEYDAELNDQHFDIDLGQLIRFNAFMGRFKTSQDKTKDLAVRRYREAMAKVYRLAFDGVLMQPNAVFTETGAKALIQQVTKYRLLLAAIGAIPTRFGAPSWKPSEYSARDLNEILKHIGINSKRCRNPFKLRLKRKLSVQMPHNLYIRIEPSAQISDEYAYKIDAEHFVMMQQLCDSLFNASEQQIAPEDMQQLADVVASVGKPDFVSDVVSLDEVQIDIASVAVVTTASEQQLAIEPCNDAVFIDVMQELMRSDLTLADLYRLKDYAEHLPKQHVSAGSAQQVLELDLINSMISSRASIG
ncbi:plasmid replication protein, CyRepA1 family [Acinetobacter sp. UBA6720]|uniref:plasmid replication protein, CyRepA1 family n=1 Tax=Acinetobacter sp. UBA6720 TaxID=1945953 RepID=UPI0025C66A47|nr:plasmid replication protein, CyRepA1 family [Acinetobacter sp. UBA6720]